MEEEEERTKKQRGGTNLVDQKLELDDSGAALVLTVALHARTAKAESRLGQRKLDRCQQGKQFNIIQIKLQRRHVCT